MSDVTQSDLTSAQMELHIDESALERLVEIDARCGIQNYGRMAVAFKRGEGARLWDTSGKRYLDFLGGIAVVTVGHAHPYVTQAIADQAATLVHSSNMYYIEPQVELARRLNELAGGEENKFRTFFCNSGAEANEAALKLARKYVKSVDANRYEIITLENSFHGRTYGSLAATGQPKYHEGFEPMPGGFTYVPRNDIAALEAAVNKRTAAIMLEPIFGESGILPVDEAYLQAARRLCDEHGMLLIFDEVQTGVGRTGTFWAWQQLGVTPDIVTMAKGLGNGVPIGALMARDEVAKAFVPGTHGCTFGGNFLSTAAANATIDVLLQENLMENATRVGKYFEQQLHAWGEATGLVKEVRGRGLMIGVELNQPIARDLMKKSLENGLIFNAVGDSILRFLPPLCIVEADVDEAMEKLQAAYVSIKETASV
jgi:predicted acetylornithine/succinylornithine family transaminase